MLQDDFEKCKNIYSMNRGHKHSPIESLCKQVSEMSVDEIIEQEKRMDVVKYFSTGLNKMHL